MVAFADWRDINAHLNHLLNRSGTVFSHLGDTGASADDRYNDDVINSARRLAAYRIIEAIASKVNHPYWGLLAAFEEVQHGAVIPPYYGEIGIPEITINGVEWRTGIPAKPDEIDSYRANTNETYSNFYGIESSQDHAETTEEDAVSPMAFRYSTSSGIFKFTGRQGRIPMIKVPDTSGGVHILSDQRLPYHLAALNVKLAMPLLTKEGDNSYRIAAYLSAMGEQELAAIRAGATQVAPIDINKAVQLAQRVS